MRGHGHLFGTFVDVPSPLHRAPLWLKFAGLVVVSGGVLAAGRVEVTLVALLGVLLAYPVAARLPLAQPGRALKPLVLLLAVLFAFHLAVDGWRFAAVVTGNLTLCVLAARLLTLTTPGPRLLDGLVSAARPLRVFGVDPERFGLLVALMMRSLPYLLGSVQDVGDAARARGLERNLRARVMPVVVGAVAYAQQTGQALEARGLLDDDASPEDERPEQDQRDDQHRR